MTRKSPREIERELESLDTDDGLPPLSAVLRGEAEIPPIEEDDDE